MYSKYFKRIIDFVISFFSFLLLSPIFILITIFLSISYKGNPFFTQVRPGYHKKLFRVIKFKTMNNKVDDDGNLLPDAVRLTTIGKFIRSTSLDEIPQLLNVIKGDMSLIGPRPLLIQYLDRYSSEQSKRHSVRPGITGWAQVNGRNTITWDKKLALDVYYVENISLKLDIKIILLTLIKVLKREDINSQNSATMEEFLGNNNK